MQASPHWVSAEAWPDRWHCTSTSHTSPLCRCMPYMQQSTWMWYCGQKVRAVVNFSSSCSGRYVEDEWSVGSLKIHWWWLINASWRRHSSVGVQLTAFIRHRMASHWRSSAVEYGGCKNVRSPLLRIQSYESLPLFFFFFNQFGLSS